MIHEKLIEIKTYRFYTLQDAIKGKELLYETI
jgi:hypothetical protein